MKLEPGEFKVITSLPIKPRYCCRLSLGGQLISWANSAAHQKHKLENLHGVMDMDMMTGCSDLCPLCGGGTHAEMGPSRIFPAPLLTPFQLVLHSSRSCTPEMGFQCWWELQQSHSCCFWAPWTSAYKFLDASRDEWAEDSIPLQYSFIFLLWAPRQNNLKGLLVLG